MAAFEESQQQEQLAAYRRTLAHAVRQLTRAGGYASAPLTLLNTIDEHCGNISQIKAWLRARDIPVDDEVNDFVAQRLRSLPGNDGPRVGDTPLGTRAVLGQFNDGLGALRELSEQVPQIHDAAIQFRTIFRAACEQSTTLRCYKALHDQLHTIQFRCYDNIEQEIQRFPKRDQSAANLAEYAANLGECIDDMRAIVADTPLLTPAPAWIETLAQAHAQILGALERADAALLRNAASKMRRVLSIDPSLINTQLTATVRSMRLALLIESMAAIHATCVELNSSMAIVERFAEGLAALRELHEHLTTLTYSHDQWQDVDKLLRTQSYSGGKKKPSDSRDDLTWLWDEVKARGEHLYASSTEPWAHELRTNAAQVDQAMQQNDARTFRQQFMRYRSLAMKQFYRVDKDLKRICDKLDRVGGPFAFVIRVLA